MQPAELKDLTREKLVEERAKLKKNSTINRFIIGFLVGVAIYNAASGGSWAFTILPVFFAIYAFTNRKQIRAIDEELESRA